MPIAHLLAKMTNVAMMMTMRTSKVLLLHEGCCSGVAYVYWDGSAATRADHLSTQRFGLNLAYLPSLEMFQAAVEFRDWLYHGCTWKSRTVTLNRLDASDVAQSY